MLLNEYHVFVVFAFGFTHQAVSCIPDIEQIELFCVVTPTGCNPCAPNARRAPDLQYESASKLTPTDGGKCED